MTHGTYTGYTRHGCRCMACTRANREYIRPNRRPVNLPTVHGTNTLIAAPEPSVERRVTGISGMTSGQVLSTSGVRVWCRCGNSGYANKWVVGKARKIDSCEACR